MLKGYKSIHEGTISPLFYYLLFMLKEKVKELLEQGLQEDPSLFLIDFTMGADNSIHVVIDGDHGVTVSDCIKISRESIVLEWKAREPKPIGKGKVTVQKKEEVNFSDIIKAKVVLKF